MPLGEWVSVAAIRLVKWEESFNKELDRKRGFVFKANTLLISAKQIGGSCDVEGQASRR